MVSLVFAREHGRASVLFIAKTWAWDRNWDKGDKIEAQMNQRAI